MKRFTNVFKSESGFTLVELLVVIAVLAILAAVAVPRLSGVRDRAYEAEAQHGLDAFKTGVQMYDAEHGFYPNNQTTFHDDVASVYVDQFSGGLYEGWTVTYSVSSTESPWEEFEITLSKTLDSGSTITVTLPHDGNGYGQVQSNTSS